MPAEWELGAVICATMDSLRVGRRCWSESEIQNHVGFDISGRQFEMLIFYWLKEAFALLKHEADGRLRGDGVHNLATKTGLGDMFIYKHLYTHKS